MIGLYPGTFDPMTNGHLDIIRRGAGFVDKLIVAVMQNVNKSSWLTLEERILCLKETCVGLPNVEVLSFKGLVTQFAVTHGVNVIIRGLRTHTDFDFEYQMALNNYVLAENIESIYLFAKSENMHISSSGVKEILSFNGDVSSMVPPVVLKKLQNIRTEGR